MSGFACASVRTLERPNRVSDPFVEYAPPVLRSYPIFCPRQPRLLMRLSPASRFNLFIFGTVALLFLYAACGGRDIVGDTKALFKKLFGPDTPREAYRKFLKRSDTVGERDLELWDAAYEVARSTALRPTVPHREFFSLDGDLLHSAQGLRLEVPPGRRLRIRGAGGPSGPLFGELFALRKGKAKQYPVATWDTLTREITYETEQRVPEEVVLVLQSAPRQAIDFDLQITSEPVLQFPVQGKDDRAIQSFWGAPRDGGKRQHEGNDIFAPKGTPLLALTDGKITRVNNGGLGGKTIWLDDADRNLRYYYAHLDEQLVNKGAYVRRGDVIGTVGNTGNARTTPPHLHLGIYAGKAIDPYPFLQRRDELPPRPSYQLPAPAAAQKVPKSGNHFLRLAPSRDGLVFRQLDNGEAVNVLGASGRFYRILTGKGETGYANFD